MKNKRLLALCVALLLVLSFAMPVSATDVETNVIRVAGSNRYDTAIQVNKHFTESKYAVLASGEGFADALTGGQLAGILNAPIYLTPAKALPSGVLNEFTRLGVEEIYIVGGTSSVSAAVEETLKEAYTVHRLSGANRYETAQAVVNLMVSTSPDSTPLYFADGRNFPDALSANPYVTANKGILELISGDHTVYSKDYLYPARAIFGGENSVKTIDVPRIAGANRYATSMEIFKKFDNPETVILVDGTNYPDALSAAGYAADIDAPIVLVAKSGLTAEQKDLLKDVNLVIISGGTNSVSEKVEQDAKEMLGLIEPTPSQEPLAQIEGRDFEFSSGAGGWIAGSTFGKDGVFSGFYYHGNAVENSLSMCEFKGKLEITEKVDDYTYKMKLVNIEVISPTGTQIKSPDGTLYKYHDFTYGYEESKNFELYLPGKSDASLSEDFKGWVRHYPNGTGRIDYYGIFNADKGYGMYSKSDGTSPSKPDIDHPEVPKTTLPEGLNPISASAISTNETHIQPQKAADGKYYIVLPHYYMEVPDVDFNRVKFSITPLKQSEYNQFKGDGYYLWIYYSMPGTDHRVNLRSIYLNSDYAAVKENIQYNTSPTHPIGSNYYFRPLLELESEKDYLFIYNEGHWGSAPLIASHSQAAVDAYENTLAKFDAMQVVLNVKPIDGVSSFNRVPSHILNALDSETRQYHDNYWK